MNKILLVAMLSAMLTNSLHAQKTKSGLNNFKGENLNLDYLRKSKDQIVFAYILLTSGLVLGVVGSVGTIIF